ncbi:hypothetical protein [Streptosporangium sp. NPDC048865]|uniref:hypothetical protein n=1 Tax=Streptosporangium sp. NPDC048865 TaxID=3155766 RepID=UPI00342CAAEF
MSTPIPPPAVSEDRQPAGRDVAAARTVRDAIEARVRVLVGGLLPGATPAAREPA